MGEVKNLDSANVYIKQEQIALESGKVMSTYERDITVTGWLQRSEGTQAFLNNVFHTSENNPSDTNFLVKNLSKKGEN